MFVLNPFFNWVYMVYGIFTAGQRTWGGPRADAGSADAGTTAQQVIEEAEARGDDLEVIPESFKPAAEARNQGLTQRRVPTVPLQPGDNIDGRFAAPELLPDGFYSYPNESRGTLPDFGPRNPNAPHIPLHPRASFDSMASGFTGTGSAVNSVYMPRRVESIMGEEDRRKYMVAQAGQREAGGAYMEEPRERYNEVYGYKHDMESSDSIISSGSYYAANSSKHEPHQNYSVSKEGSSAGSSPGTTPEGDATSEGNIAQLQLPEAAHGPSTGRNRYGGSARSPLARQSLVRTATSEEASSQAQSDPINEDNEDGNDEAESKSEKKRKNKLTKNRG